MSEVLVGLLRSFPWAVVGGVLVAVACAVLGVYVVLKRVVFIGVALSEVAACGVALALAAGWPPLAGAVGLTLAAAGLLAAPMERRRLPRDAALGAIFVGSSSLSVLLVARSGHGLREVGAVLYGDLLLISPSDFAAVAALAVPALAAVLVGSRGFVASFFDRDAAQVMGLRPAMWEAVFFVLLGLAVAAASKAAGALLVCCHLVVPASAALILARRMGPAMAWAAALATASTLVGLGVSLAADLPANQTICITACVLLLTVLPFAAGGRTRRAAGR